MLRALPVLLAGLVLGCTEPTDAGQAPGGFEYGRISYAEGDGAAEHPAHLDPVAVEAALAGLEYRAAEYEDRGSAELFPPAVLEATAGALAGALSRAAPEDRVAVDMAWDVGVDPTVRFVNHLDAEFHVADGALHLAVRRFHQTTGESTEPDAGHPLLVVSDHGTVRPGLADRIAIPLHREERP